MKAWSYWYPDIQPHVPGCPLPMVDHELRRACQEFFQGSRAWKVTQAAVPVNAAQENVTITPSDAEQELVRIEAAWYDGSQVPIKTVEDLDRQYGDDWTLHTGTPNCIFQVTPGIVRLYPIPLAAAATGLKVRISVRPSDSSTGVPDDMAVKFRDDLTTGAKSKLMLYANNPWTNVDMAGFFALQFKTAINGAALDAAMAFGNARKPASPKWC